MKILNILFLSIACLSVSFSWSAESNPVMDFFIKNHSYLFDCQTHPIIGLFFELKKGQELYHLLIHHNILKINDKQLPVSADLVRHTLNLPDDVGFIEDDIITFKVSLEDAVNSAGECDGIGIDY